MDNRERALRDALELFTRNYREWLDTSYADKTAFETALALARKMDPAYMAANRALGEARAAIEGEPPCAKTGEHRWVGGGDYGGHAGNDICADCGVDAGDVPERPAAPLPTAREAPSAQIELARKQLAAIDKHGEPVSSVQINIDVLRALLEEHGETCPHPVSEGRLREALAGLLREWRHQASEFDDQSALLCAKQLERALESA